MSLGACGRELAARAGQRQLERLPPGERFALLGRHRPARGSAADGFRLLELDVFALEAAGHEGMTTVSYTDAQRARARHAAGLARHYRQARSSRRQSVV